MITMDMTEKQKLEATLDWIHEKDQKKRRKKRGGIKELHEADAEEVEDKLIEEV